LKGFLFKGVGQMRFEQMVSKVSPGLRNIARKLDGRYTTFTDDDLYQEAMVDLWLKHKAGATVDKTDSYLLQGCFFFLKNYIRKAYNSADRVSSSLQEYVTEDLTREDLLEQKGGDFSVALENKVLLEQFWKLLNSREKTVLSLMAEGRTSREIGRKIGLSHVMVLKIKNRIQEKCGPDARVTA
jgi:RNA polymerase sigma factor (sigma-70 family)